MSDTQNTFEIAKKIQTALRAEVFGQDRAIETITDAIKNNILPKKRSPKMTFLFLGPPATGKSHVAEILSENLEGYKLRTFDMTQYHEQNGGELYGYPKGWSGYSVGQLTGFVHDNPKAIIVLDNFEKADNIIQTNLLTIFQGGFMRDQCGWDKITQMPCNDDPEKVYDESNAEFIVDFTQTIFIITTTLGEELYNDHKFLQLVEDDYIQAETMILETLKREEKRDHKSGGTQKAIIPELVSRLSQATLVFFEKLNYTAYEQIGKQAFEAYAQMFERRYDIVFEAGRNYEMFLKTQILQFAPELDAIRIKNKTGESFFAKAIRHIDHSGKDPAAYRRIKVSLSKKTARFIKEEIEPLIAQNKLAKELFRKNLKLEADESWHFKEGTLTYKVHRVRFTKIKKIKDFAEDGLVFDIPETTFDDIAGHPEAKARLKEVIHFLKEPALLRNFGVNPPKGILLYGPPGTGKTMLAKAFANEAELPFISITGVELLKLDKIKSVFKKARQYSPSIIFIDEIDTIGRRQKDKTREVQINKFLSEIDGFATRNDEPVFIIAATNYKENIDKAILRPGRIEIHIGIDNLDDEARRYFLEKIIRSKPTEGEFDIDKLTALTEGMTGAQLELAGKEASFYCIRKKIPRLTHEILLDHIISIKQAHKQAQESSST